MSFPPLSSLYNSEAPVFSLEFFPAKKAEALDSTKATIEKFTEFNIGYMTVTYGAGGSTRGNTLELTRFIHNQLKVRAVSHLTCVQHSREELFEIASSLQRDGITDILALRGDAPQSSVDGRFIAQDGGFECARDLIKFLKLEFPKNSILAAGYPESHREAVSFEADIAYLAEKVHSGAEIILTQLFFDTNMYFTFIERCKKAGINIPIVPGIMPIRDKAQLERFTSMCGSSIPLELREKLSEFSDPNDVIKFGTEYATQMSKELLKGGAPGIHLYTLNKSGQVCEVLKELS